MFRPDDVGDLHLAGGHGQRDRGARGDGRARRGVGVDDRARVLVPVVDLGDRRRGPVRHPAAPVGAAAWVSPTTTGTVTLRRAAGHGDDDGGVRRRLGLRVRVLGDDGALGLVAHLGVDRRVEREAHLGQGRPSPGPWSGRSGRGRGPWCRHRRRRCCAASHAAPARTATVAMPSRTYQAIRLGGLVLLVRRRQAATGVICWVASMPGIAAAAATADGSGTGDADGGCSDRPPGPSPLEVGRHLGRGLVAVGRVLGERLHDDRVVGRRDLGIELRRRRRRLADVLVRDRRPGESPMNGGRPVSSS